MYYAVDKGRHEVTIKKDAARSTEYSRHYVMRSYKGMQGRTYAIQERIVTNFFFLSFFSNYNC
jgi:hypothetical protein